MKTAGAEPVELSAVESRILRQLARSGKPIALRAQIILACSEGVTAVAISKQLKVSRETVRKWRDRFQEDRLEGLSDRPRPGPPRAISDESARCLVAATLELPAPGGIRWTTRSMAAERGLSQTVVSRIWRDAGLRPDLVETWRLVFDPDFVARVRGIAGVLLAPGGGALALAVRRGARKPGDAAPEPVVRTHPDSGWTRDLPRFLDAVDAGGQTDPLHVLCSDERALATYPVRHWLARKPHIRCQAIPGAARWSVLVDRWLGAVDTTPQVAELRTRARGWTRLTEPDCPAPWPPTQSGDPGTRVCPCRIWGDPDGPTR
ncbi:helix-turn-helix domain-containing protein [Actinokineospora sp. 24-640]